jgi:hypothetical protein
VEYSKSENFAVGLLKREDICQEIVHPCDRLKDGDRNRLCSDRVAIPVADIIASLKSSGIRIDFSFGKRSRCQNSGFPGNGSFRSETFTQYCVSDSLFEMTRTVTLVHPHETLQVSAQLLIDKCNLFSDNRELTASPYTPVSQISLRVFREFASAVEGTAVVINNDNFIGLLRLCKEFRFRDLTAQISQFLNSDDFKEEALTEDAENRAHLWELDESMHLYDRKIDALRGQIMRESGSRESAVKAMRAEVEAARHQANEVQTDVAQIRIELDRLRELFTEVRALSENAREIALTSKNTSEGAQTKADATEARIGPLRSDVDRLRNELKELRESTESARKVAPASTTPPEGAQKKAESTEARTGPIRSAVDRPREHVRSPPGWNSVIISDFPEIFTEFRQQRFSLLWRGSRDGFAASDFHNRCDGHTNTLTVILDTNNNIFGGFTPVAWESRQWNGKDGKQSNCRKSDPTRKSFLFTLRNPHNVSSRRFPLKYEESDGAIYCVDVCGPHFYDIGVSKNCHANMASFTSSFGSVYTNDTGVDGGLFFTNSRSFKVKEVEIFEITE